MRVLSVMPSCPRALDTSTRRDEKKELVCTEASGRLVIKMTMGVLTVRANSLVASSLVQLVPS